MKTFVQNCVLKRYNTTISSIKDLFLHNITISNKSKMHIKQNCTNNNWHGINQFKSSPHRKVGICKIKCCISCCAKLWSKQIIKLWFISVKISKMKNMRNIFIVTCSQNEPSWAPKKAYLTSTIIRVIRVYSWSIFYMVWV